MIPRYQRYYSHHLFLWDLNLAADISALQGVSVVFSILLWRHKACLTPCGIMEEDWTLEPEKHLLKGFAFY